MTLKFLTLAAAMSGALLGAASSLPAEEESASQQCFYRVGVDAENSCTSCKDLCRGDGYKCCNIVVVE
ncbi:MAG: hypothetical protein AB1941_02210 [Gemmatimonadota bacterium]